MDHHELELITLHKKNELLRGYLNEVVGLINLENLKIILVVAPGRKGIGT